MLAIGQEGVDFPKIPGNSLGIWGLWLDNLLFYRIILTIEITEKEIVLLDIGSHDEVYR
jgi:hypothetical protein